jgi:hypothetical protein
VAEADVFAGYRQTGAARYFRLLRPHKKKGKERKAMK